jgi:hypothetical protein
MQVAAHENHGDDHDHAGEEAKPRGDIHTPTPERNSGPATNPIGEP